ncbi:transporter [Marinobacterium stanieri]|uniref:transporter n=1 Tax=Marinobacterium stanieri TaxID=49186 RepID=UPI0002558F2F|nr:transporter [Marinobacterium stanieri]
MINYKKTILSSAILLGSLSVAQQAMAIAETVHPRDYIPAPAGTNLSVTYLNHRSADNMNVDGDTVSKNAGFEANAMIQRFIHFTEFMGMPADPQVIIPVVDLDVGIAGQESQGVGDIFFGSTFWPLADAENKQWFGITPFIYMPTGEYNSDKGVNLGANRWSYVLQAGYTKGLTDGLFFEVVGEVEWYGDNDDYVGGTTLSKDETYRFNTMLSYDVGPGRYVWGRYTKQVGGEESVSGASQDNEMDTDTMSLGYSHWVGQDFQLQAEYTRDLEVENGFETDGVTLRLVVPF